MKKSTIVFIISFLVTLHIALEARGFRVAQIPNGSKFSCNTCHTSGGGSPRNDFGKLVEKSFLQQEGSQFNADWGPLLASLDADNDGVTNGQELQDPYGLWSVGMSAPGDASLVTSAGIGSTSPLTTLTVNFSGMTPHVGQQLWLRVYNKNDMKEVGRTSVTITETFVVNLDVLLIGYDYNIDFFADHNTNNSYDSPPTDHAWRIELNDAQGNDVIEFSHNTNFVDIAWPNLLTINFSGMTPHIGQLLEIRVEDDLTSEEIGRKRIEFIPGADFTVQFPGIVLDREYNIEMYSDHNNNGIYDEPPTDHAWEEKFTNTTGDFTVEFAHNTNFKDIGWKYLYTLNFVDLAPHVGQLLELRVVRNDNSEEVDRTSIIVPAATFSLSIPQIEMNHDYNVDFYADHNNNQSYDSPPDDHAWRLSFNSSTGNFVQNFTHNANFVDIGWTNVTGIEDNNEVPNRFVLNQNYPNPFNPSTSISFNLIESGSVRLKIYDMLGREIITLLNQKLSSGLHQVQFDATNLNSGTYYYRIESESFTETKKMILLK